MASARKAAGCFGRSASKVRRPRLRPQVPCAPGPRPSRPRLPRPRTRYPALPLSSCVRAVGSREPHLSPLGHPQIGWLPPGRRGSAREDPVKMGYCLLQRPAVGDGRERFYPASGRPRCALLLLLSPLAALFAHVGFSLAHELTTSKQTRRRSSRVSRLGEPVVCSVASDRPYVAAICRTALKSMAGSREPLNS